MSEPEQILQRNVAELLDVCARIPGGIRGLTASEDGAIIDVIEVAQMIVQSAQGILAACSS